MTNEENKAPVEEQAAPAAPESPKKLSTPVLVGIIAGAVVIIAVVVVLCVVLLGGCKEHIDANDDFLCDNCGADFNDGIEVIYENVSFSLQLGDKTPLANVGFSLTKGEDGEPIYLVTGTNGKVTHTLEAGRYTIEYDYETGISAYMSSDTYALTVTKGMGEVVITFNDNTPDGSAEKPFYISENETEITLEPGAELYFNYRGAATKYLTIESEELVVIYEDVEYTAVNGVIEVTVTPKEIGISTVFVIKNISDGAVNEIMTFLAPLGSIDNPYDLNENDECQTVPAEGTIYYKWTAYEDMMLVIFVPDHRYNSIGITKVLENDVPISSSSAGEQFVYMPVFKNEVITISVSTNKKEDTVVEFEGYFFTGDEADSVPVLMNDMDISFAPGAAYTFSAKAGNTITVNDENASVTYNGTTYTPDANGKIEFTAEAGCDYFTVENTSDNINAIEINVEGTLDDKPEYISSGNNPPSEN